MFVHLSIMIIIIIINIIIIIIIIYKSGDKIKRKNSEVLRSIRTTRKYLDFLDVLLTTQVQDECMSMYGTLYVYMLQYIFI